MSLHRIVVTYLIVFALVRVANDSSTLLMGSGVSLAFSYAIPAGLALLWEISMARRAKDKRSLE
jgi:hypothetical protein